jgi:hypothetical protein
MPLRDPFHAPLVQQRSWEEIHGAWPSVMAFRLNSLLPPCKSSPDAQHATGFLVTGFQRQHHAEFLV